MYLELFAFSNFQIVCGCYSPDGTMVLCGYNNGVLLLAKYNTKCIISFLCGHHWRCGQNSVLTELPPDVLVSIAYLAQVKYFFAVD